MQSCSSAFHRARLECNILSNSCLKEHGIFEKHEDCPCDHPTRCVVSGDSRSHWICTSSNPNPADQTVNGMPRRGAGHVRAIVKE